MSGSRADELFFVLVHALLDVGPLRRFVVIPVLVRRIDAAGQAGSDRPLFRAAGTLAVRIERVPDGGAGRNTHPAVPRARAPFTCRAMDLRRHELPPMPYHGARPGSC